MIINMDKSYTSAGDPVTLWKIDGPHPGYPVIGHRADGVPAQWTAGGRCAYVSSYDLVEVRSDVVRWYNVYVGGMSGGFSTQKYAEANRSENCIALLKATFPTDGSPPLFEVLPA
jgi:hypothetical protein